MMQTPERRAIACGKHPHTEVSAASIPTVDTSASRPTVASPPLSALLAPFGEENSESSEESLCKRRSAIFHWAWEAKRKDTHIKLGSSVQFVTPGMGSREDKKLVQEVPALERECLQQLQILY